MLVQVTVRPVSSTQLELASWYTLQYLTSSGHSAEATALSQPQLLVGLLDTPQAYLMPGLIELEHHRHQYYTYLDSSTGLNKKRF